MKTTQYPEKSIAEQFEDMNRTQLEKDKITNSYIVGAFFLGILTAIMVGFILFCIFGR